MLGTAVIDSESSSDNDIDQLPQFRRFLRNELFRNPAFVKYFKERNLEETPECFSDMINKARETTRRKFLIYKQEELFLPQFEWLIETCLQANEVELFGYQVFRKIFEGCVKELEERRSVYCCGYNDYSYAKFFDDINNKKTPYTNLVKNVRSFLLTNFPNPIKLDGLSCCISLDLAETPDDTCYFNLPYNWKCLEHKNFYNSDNENIPPCQCQTNVDLIICLFKRALETIFNSQN